MENNFKHTPAPWTSGIDGHEFEKRNGIGYIPVYTGDPDRGWIAEAKGNHVNHGMTGEEMLANAKLIAAAPELLEACIKALDNLHNGEANTKYRLIEVLQTLEEAIKKATE